MNHTINKKCLITVILAIVLIFVVAILEVLDGFILKPSLLIVGLIIIGFFVKQTSKKAQCNVSIKTEEERINYIDSIIDSNTQLYNKDYLQTEFTKVFDCNPSMFKESICVFIDIDNFKILKDKFGELQEDTTLKKLGEIICESKREGDFSFKYSIDQFLIFYINTNKDHIFNKIDHIRYKFKEFTQENFKLPGTKFTLSIGMSHYQYGEDLTDIIHRANKAMYVSKYSGKDKISTL